MFLSLYLYAFIERSKMSASFSFFIALLRFDMVFQPCCGFFFKFKLLWRVDTVYDRTIHRESSHGFTVKYCTVGKRLR